MSHYLEVGTWGRCARCCGAVRLLDGEWHHPGEADHAVSPHPAYRLMPARAEAGELVLAEPEHEAEAADDPTEREAAARVAAAVVEL